MNLSSDNRIFQRAQPSLYKTGMLILVVLLSVPTAALAVTGQAERLDEVKEADLKEFQQALAEEEQRRNLEKADDIVSTLKRRRRELETAEGEEKKLIERELEHLEKELLNLPERDRIRFNIDGNVRYDPNIGRDQPSETSSDAILSGEGSVEFDLSLKKTDLRWEFGVGRIWNVKFSRNDFWTANTQIRYRRKMFKKITHSLHSRLSRTSSRTIEIDDDRIRWDMNNSTAFNYQFSPKFSVNMGLSQQKRFFTQEEFDQDSGWGIGLNPAFFWQFSPKSRVSLGYNYSARRDRVETGDANSHDISAGYFGQLTRKSSVSFDVGYTRQNPKSIEGSTVNSWRTGLGWIYQWTSKTQAAVNLFRSWQNTSSKRVSITSDEVERSDNSFSNDSLTVNLNSRLTKRLAVTMSTGISHIKTELDRSDEDGDGDGGDRRFTFPNSINFSYLVNRWLRVTAGYAFFYRTGNEKEDLARSHSFNGGFNLIF